MTTRPVTPVQSENNHKTLLGFSVFTLNTPGSWWQKVQNHVFGATCMRKGTWTGQHCSKTSQTHKGRAILVFCGVCLGFYLPLKHAIHIKLSTASVRLSPEGTERTGYKKVIRCLSSFQQEFLILDITKLFRQSCCFPRSSSKSARAWKCKDSVMSFVIHTYCKFSEQTHIHKQHSQKYPIQGVRHLSASLVPNCRSGAAR